MQGRDESEVLLLTVTKTVAIDGIQSAYDLGLGFGENLPRTLAKSERTSEKVHSAGT
jgi:uncharacterized pyridoxal phosphate-containing UPF0001 family protein